MRGEPGNRERGDGTVLRDALLLGLVLAPPKAAGFDFGFDFGFAKCIVVIVAGRVWESGKPGFGFPLFQARPAGAVGMWKSRGVGEISKGRWEEWETCFWFSTLSTAPAFPQLPLGGWVLLAIEPFTCLLAISSATPAWLSASVAPPLYRSFAAPAVEASAR